MNSSERFHALDAARALALLLGIVLHATMSFFLVIPGRDVSQSTTLGVVFFAIHTFRMTLFFLIAGFFARLSFHRRGMRAFVKDRAKRIVVPMTAGWVVFAPPTIAAVIWGLSRTFSATPTASAAPPPLGFPLTHLWFLYYLSIFYLAALAGRAVFVAVDGDGAKRQRTDAVIRTLLGSRLAPLVLAVPAFLVFSLDAAWPVWFGVSTPDTGLIPKVPALISFGTAFGFGWLLHRQTETLAFFERQWRSHLALAIALTSLCLSMVGTTPDITAPTVLAGGPAVRLAYAACYALSTWFWTFGILGAAMRFCSSESATRRYLADSSYWLYLAHLPLVFGLQVMLLEVPLHWSLKFPLIVSVATVVLLASYHYLVRRTWIGEILNGRRGDRRSIAEPLDAVETSVESLGLRSAPIARLENVTKMYGKTIALDSVDLSVRQGELLALLGPNGAGKSTAIGLWLGTLQADRGAVTIMGGSPLDVHSRLGVGVMMQEVALAPALTTREHIALAASYYRDPLTVQQALELTGTEALAEKRYGRLSAGQKRQVQFAAAVSGRPRLLFLDEPTVGLDVEARASMWRNIRRLIGEGCSVVLTTHYLEEAEALADRVVVLAGGHVIAQGSVDELRALVSRKRISCASSVAAADIRTWPGVVDVVTDGVLLRVTASDAESVVRRLLANDPALSHLEVTQATLSEAFTELTKEAA